METYKIENLDLFMSIKDLGRSKILTVEGRQRCAILPEGCQRHENSGDDEGSCFVATLSPSPKMSTKDHATNITGKTFPSPFVHKYMIEN